MSFMEISSFNSPDVYVDISPASITILLICAVAFVCLIATILKNKSDSKPSSDDIDGGGKLHPFREGTIPTPEPEPPKPPKPKPKPKPSKKVNHSIETLYVYRSSNYVWICPRCEAENYYAAEQCCVCNKKH